MPDTLFRPETSENVPPTDKWSPLKKLPFSDRVRWVLWRADCFTVSDIVEKLTKQSLADQPLSGPRTVREVEEVLSGLGLALRDEQSEDDRLDYLLNREAYLANQLKIIRKKISRLSR